jgi:hypothetical protein
MVGRLQRLYPGIHRGAAEQESSAYFAVREPGFSARNAELAAGPIYLSPRHLQQYQQIIHAQKIGADIG